MSLKYLKQSHTNLVTNFSVKLSPFPSFQLHFHNFYIQSGNLVTCKWWDQIWLNEGFATLFEYLLVDNLNSELRMKDYFNIQKVQNAFKSDSLESTRPMSYNSESPSGISGLFDRIAYDKCRSMTLSNQNRFSIFISISAGSVIRMFQYAVREDIFRDALSLYLSVK